MSHKQHREIGFQGVVVLFAAFLIWVCTYGISSSIGLYIEDLQRQFSASYAKVSLVGAINLGIFFGAGPIAGILVSNGGHRRLAIISAILSNIGLAALPFSPNILYMFFFFGVLNGTGNSLMTVSAQVLCGYHFEKYRVFTSCFVLSGAGVGATCFPYITNKLIQAYGWRGSLMLLCGINLHVLPLSLLLKPVKVITDKYERTLETANDRNAFESNTNLTHNSKNTAVRICLMASYENLKSHLRNVANIQFVTFCMSNLIYNMGYASIVIFLPQYAVSIGLNADDASLSLVLLGGGLFLGSIIAGLLGKQSQLSIYATGCIGFGCFSLLMQTFTKRVAHLCLSFIAGGFSGLQFAPLFIITCNILGIDAVGVGFGFVMCAVGVGLTAGPPSAGALVDFFAETKYMIYFNGTVAILSGTLIFPLLFRQLFKKCRSQNLFVGETPALSVTQSSCTLTNVSYISTSS